MSKDLEGNFALVDRYEGLRTLALAGGVDKGGLGFALLLGRGLAAWIKAWERCPEPSRAPRPEPAASTCAVVPSELHAEVSLVLAGMAISEVTS